MNSNVEHQGERRKDWLTHDEAMAQAFSAEEEVGWQRLAPARDLASLVVQYRLEHELSQRDVAERLGVRQPWVAQLEAAEHLPTIDTVQKVAALLGRDLRITVPAPTQRRRPQRPVTLGPVRRPRPDRLTNA